MSPDEQVEILKVDVVEGTELFVEFADGVTSTLTAEKMFEIAQEQSLFKVTQ